MLDIDRISALFSLFSDMPDEKLPLWRGLCENAAASIEKRLRDETDVKAEMERLCTAAAAVAYCDYLLISSAGVAATDEIRVGDISLRQNPASTDDTQTAIEIREQFLSGISDLLISGGFVFAGVGS